MTEDGKICGRMPFGLFGKFSFWCVCAVPILLLFSHVKWLASPAGTTASGVAGGSSVKGSHTRTVNAGQATPRESKPSGGWETALGG